MKNIFKLFGFIALAAIIVFSMAACGEGDDNPTPKPTPTPTPTPDPVIYTMNFTENTGWNETGHEDWNRWHYKYLGDYNDAKINPLDSNKAYVLTCSFTSDVDIDRLSVQLIKEDGWVNVSDWTEIIVPIPGTIPKNTRYNFRVPLFPNSNASDFLYVMIGRSVSTAATLSFYEFKLEAVNKDMQGLDKWTVSGKDIIVTDKRKTFAENLSSYQGKNNVFHIKPKYNASIYDHFVIEYDLSAYAGKKIGVEMSMDAYLNKEARVAWHMLIAPDYPLVLGYTDYNYFLSANTWHTISGTTIVDVPSSGDKRLYLSGMQIIGAEAYFANATLTIAEDPGTNTAVTLNSVTADGSASQTTTQLTLTFSQAITGLNAANINLGNTISGLTKGTLSGSGPTYTLPVSGFIQGGNLSVNAVKLGYNITGGPKTVTINYKSGGGGSTPVTPTGVITTGATSNSITIGWNPVSGATGYYIYRSSSVSGTYTQVGSATTTSYTDTGLYAGTVYYYKVAAYNSDGTGPQSSIISAATQDSSTFSFTISGTARTGQKLTAVTTGTGWTGNFKWGYADSAGANAFYYFSSGASGTNNSEFTIPAGYTGKYIRAFRFHPQGTWTDMQTYNKQFPSNFLGPVDSN